MPRRLSAASLAQLGPALAAALVFAGTVTHGFAYDDEAALRDDPRLATPFDLRPLVAQPYWPQYGTLWRPLTTLSYALDRVLGAGSPFPAHLGNVLLHAVVSALVARLALRWAAPAAAAAAGLVFAVMPVHVEAVANGVGRAELLCAVGLLTVLLAATRQGPPTLGTLRLAFAGAFLALGAKETGVFAPVLAGVAHWVTTRDWRGAARITVWAGSATAALLAGRWVVLGTLGGDGVHPAFWVAQGSTGVLLALSMIPRALWAIVVPQAGTWEPTPTAAQAAQPDLVLAALGVGLLLLAAWALWRLARDPSPAGLAVLILVACWLPVSNLLFKSGVLVAERTLYSPSIGAALLAAGLWTRVSAWRPDAASVLLVLWAAPAAALCVTDATVWRDSRAVYEAMVTRNPDSYKAWWYLSQERRQRGDYAGAYDALSASIERFDLEARILHSGGQMALAKGDTATAVRWLDRALYLQPYGRRVRTLRALVALRQGDFATTRRLMDEGLAMEPDQDAWIRIRALAGPP